MPIFADLTDDDQFKNDKTGVVEFFDNNFIGSTMVLEKFVGGVWTQPTLLINHDFGSFYPFGFNNSGSNIYGENMIGYVLEWRKVLQSYGVGTYRVKFSATAFWGAEYLRYTESYCLKHYDPFEIDNTVRIEYWRSGNIGDKVGLIRLAI